MKIASIHRRLFAYVIDSIILQFLFSPLYVTINIFLDEHSLLVGHLFYVFTHCSYFTYFLSSNAQATPGQKLMNIYTINLDHYKIDLNLAFDRTISQHFIPILHHMTLVLIKSLKTDTFNGNALIILYILYISTLSLDVLWDLMACFSKRKQTFHDILFNTTVVVAEKN